MVVLLKFPKILTGNWIKLLGVSSPLFMYQFDLESQALADAYSGTGAALYDYIA